MPEWTPGNVKANNKTRVISDPIKSHMPDGEPINVFQIVNDPGIPIKVK